MKFDCNVRNLGFLGLASQISDNANNIVFSCIMIFQRPSRAIYVPRFVRAVNDPCRALKYHNALKNNVIPLLSLIYKAKRQNRLAFIENQRALNANNARKTPFMPGKTQ